MTPQRIKAIIQEANMTHFKGHPAQIVIVDHLGILMVDDDAPRDIKGNEQAQPGHVMQELFKVCKSTNVFMFMLQQLPKEVPPGEAFSYDAGRGGSKQTDYCDYIFQIWRPEQKQGLDDDERRAVEGQYKLALGKNRYGASTVAHLNFISSLRIVPALDVTQPSFVNPDGPVIEIEGAEEEISLEISAEEAAEISGKPVSDAGRSPLALEELTRETDTTPVDTKEIASKIEEIGGESDLVTEDPWLDD